MIGKSSVFLVGPMGSGKTAVGRHLARVLQLPFHDSDAEIERRTGVDIPFIFDKEGEDPPGVAVGTLSLYYGEHKVGEGRIRTQPAAFGLAGKGLCVGRDLGVIG